MKKLILFVVAFGVMCVCVLVPKASQAEPVGMTCYKVKDKASYVKATALVELDSAFGTFTDCRPAKIRARYLCLPSTVTITDMGTAPGGSPVGEQDLSFEFQTCYKVSCRDAIPPGGWFTEDGYGPRGLDKPRLAMYCIPASTP